MVKPSEKFEKAAPVLKALAHQDRLAIVELLQDGEMCVSDIIDHLGIKQAITSQHLSTMRDKGVLKCRREGSKVYYDINNPNVIKLLQCISEKCDR